jgi:quercetin dioxygenase-like cupin family protein
MTFLDIENRAIKELVPGVNIRSFWGEKIQLITVIIDPGAHVPTHKHPQEQSGAVLTGKVTFTIGDETRTLEPGDCYIIPGNVEHSATGGDVETRLVETFCPIREDLKY